MPPRANNETGRAAQKGHIFQVGRGGASQMYPLPGEAAQTPLPTEGASFIPGCAKTKALACKSGQSCAERAESVDLNALYIQWPAIFFVIHPAKWISVSVELLLGL